MNTKERLYAVIGGCVGAMLTMVVCSFFPLGVQSQSDRFGEITCTRLKVVDSYGRVGVELRFEKYGGHIEIKSNEHSTFDTRAKLGVNEHGGYVAVFNEDLASASMGIDKHGGSVRVVTEFLSLEERRRGGHLRINERGGTVNVNGLSGAASMEVSEHGGNVNVFSAEKNGGPQAHMGVDEHGGVVSVFGKGGNTSRAIMGVSEYGNGAVNTWDKNGYRQ